MKKNVEFLYFCASKRHMVIILVQHTVHVFEDPEAKSEGKKRENRGCLHDNDMR